MKEDTNQSLYQEGIFFETNRQISKMHLLKCYSKYLTFFCKLAENKNHINTQGKKMQFLLNKIWKGGRLGYVCASVMQSAYSRIAILEVCWKKWQNNNTKDNNKQIF